MKPAGRFVDHAVGIAASPSPGVRGAARSFEDFYRSELHGQVRRAAFLLGSSVAANDAVHDAFAAVYARWDTLTEPGPYLNRCVLNRCRDLRRRPRTVPSTGVPDFVGDRSEDIALWDALRRLPLRQQAALVMRYWDGMDEQQIADALGVRPGSVGSLLTRGKRNLERRWER